jgi:hypothetical protein
LQQITRDAKIGRRTADKLVKVWLVNGRETWVLVHVEVQAQEDPNFAERMFVYHYRIFDRYHRQVVSLAVLADERTKWRPEAYERLFWEELARYEEAGRLRSVKEGIKKVEDISELKALVLKLENAQ